MGRLGSIRADLRDRSLTVLFTEGFRAGEDRCGSRVEQKQKMRAEQLAPKHNRIMEFLLLV